MMLVMLLNIMAMVCFVLCISSAM
ncbi:hypothetical protein F383_30712 [Gossypium arboreum]|uniref:Uncharacterized protein n=1 Tax=Gossypium arboreum TaxID=29729 RepID=A0A0B0MXR3_GOSAR|nr:hypothetical protein F383_30712 [Gossypium arboreum]